MKTFEIEYICAVKTKGSVQAESKEEAEKIFRELTGKQDEIILRGTPVNNRITKVIEKEECHVI